MEGVDRFSLTEVTMAHLQNPLFFLHFDHHYEFPIHNAGLI